MRHIEAAAKTCHSLGTTFFLADTGTDNLGWAEMTAAEVRYGTLCGMKDRT